MLLSFGLGECFGWKEQRDYLAPTAVSIFRCGNWLQEGDSLPDFTQMSHFTGGSRRGAHAHISRYRWEVPGYAPVVNRHRTLLHSDAVSLSCCWGKVKSWMQDSCPILSEYSFMCNIHVQSRGLKVACLGRFAPFLASLFLVFNY